MKQLLSIFCLQCCCLFSDGQQPLQLHDRFSLIGIQHGLPEASANVIFQDSQGYIWIGTQNGLVRYDGYTVKQYPIERPASNELYIYSIMEDSKAGLWLGGGDALYYYNRSTDAITKQPIPVFKPDIHFRIWDLKKAANGNIWLHIWLHKEEADAVGLLDTRTGKTTLYSYLEKGPQYFADKKVYGSATDQQGKLWMPTEKGILEYDAATKKFITHTVFADTAVHRRYSTPFYDTGTNRFWFSITNDQTQQKEGIAYYSPIKKGFSFLRHQAADSSSLPNDTVFSITKDAQKRIWLGSRNGLMLYHEAAGKFTAYPFSGSEDYTYANAVAKILEDKRGGLWCWTGKGLAYFDIQQHSFRRDTSFALPGSLLSNSIRSITVDKGGIPWMGIAQQGVQWLNKSQSKINYYNGQAGPFHFSGGMAGSFAETADGNVWLGSEKGLYTWQPSTGRFTEIPLGHAGSASVSPILADREGNIWFSSMANNALQGLGCYTPATKKTVYYKSSPADSLALSTNYITALYEDRSGTIWVGSYGGGLCSFNKQTKKFKRYAYTATQDTVKNALDDDDIMTIYERKPGELWIGTNNGSLNQLDTRTGKFTLWLGRHPTMKCITDINADAEGNLWVGSYMSGLYRIDKTLTNIEAITEKEGGLLYNGIWGMHQAKNGQLWIGTPRGISIYHPQSKTFRSLTTANGLPEYAVAHPLFTTRSGLMMYGCKDGFVAFNPADFAPDSTVPTVHITTIAYTLPGGSNSSLQDSVLYRYGKSNIALAYNQNRITFSYVGLLYQNAASVQYAYKLEGYDKDWVQAGTQRSVTYTSLPAGKYTFRVKSANPDGIWNTEEDSIDIIISPPWWATWWAYALYIIIAGIAIAAYIRWRSKKLLWENKQLEEKVQQRTAEVQEQKEELAAQRDHLEQTLENLQSTQAQLIQSEKMASLGELTAGIAHEIQNPLNFVNNFSEVSNEMIEELQAERQKPVAERDESLETEILEDLTGNLQKIAHHGKRAEAIVKGMLQHSRNSGGKKELTDINALADEYLRLSYHGLRAKDKSFNAGFTTDFDESIGKINMVPQDMGRVLLNLFHNAFYAVKPPHPLKGESYHPMVTVKTWALQPPLGGVGVSVTDNGTGIPQPVIDKIFQPFFTTKPTGEGTGLGLSLAYDIITKGHGGKLTVESEEGKGTTFIIQLPG